MVPLNQYTDLMALIWGFLDPLLFWLRIAVGVVLALVVTAFVMDSTRGRALFSSRNRK